MNARKIMQSQIEKVGLRSDIPSCLRYLGIVLVLALTGCAQEAVKKEQYSGFLGDYSKFEEMESSDGEVIVGWMNPDIRGTYHAIILDPVVIYPSKRSFERFDEDEVADTLAYINKRFREELGSRFKLAHEPGPGVLRWRVALTALDVGFKPMEWYQYMPVTAAVTAAGEAAGTRDEGVQLIVESELSDSRTGITVAAGVRLGSSSVEDSAPVELKNIKPIIDEWAKSSGLWVDKNLK
jgi:hypothetical protein